MRTGEQGDLCLRGGRWRGDKDLSRDGCGRYNPEQRSPIIANCELKYTFSFYYIILYIVIATKRLSIYCIFEKTKAVRVADGSVSLNCYFFRVKHVHKTEDYISPISSPGAIMILPSAVNLSALSRSKSLPGAI